MGLLEEVAPHVQKPGFGCSVGIWLTEHPEYTNQELHEAVKAHSGAAVWRLMQTKGFDKRQLALMRHLNGECACR